MNNNLNYYDNNADQFFDQTYQVDMHSLYQLFLQRISQGGTILDLGCGSGRDTLAFKNMGYKVDAVDASPALVAKAQQLTGLQVRCASFYDLAEIDTYHGIWACASLLHCKRQRLPEMMGKIIDALKADGVCYMSFKYGSTDHEKDGRYFTDLNEAQATTLLQPFAQIEIIQQWITIDQRPDRSEQWLNLLWKKNA